MTDENKALLADFFRRYGERADEAQPRLYCPTLHRAETINEVKRVQNYDGYAVELIRNCENIIKLAQAYRLSLAERYNYLTTTPTVPVVRLERHKHIYTNKVYYYLRTYRRMVDGGADVQESETKYPGTERRKALADFAAYVKAHPGIIAEKNIEPARWEK